MPGPCSRPRRPQIPLHVFSYKDLYGWTMDEIVREIGTRSNCTFCGVFRRQVRRTLHPALLTCCAPIGWRPGLT